MNTGQLYSYSGNTWEKWLWPESRALDAGVGLDFLYGSVFGTRACVDVEDVSSEGLLQRASGPPRMSNPRDLQSKLQGVGRFVVQKAP